MGIYRWPNGECVQGHPQGLKVTTNQALQSLTPAPIVQEGMTAYYHIDPIDGMEKNNDTNDDAVDAMKDLYPAIIFTTAEMVKIPSA